MYQIKKLCKFGLKNPQKLNATVFFFSYFTTMKCDEIFNMFPTCVDISTWFSTHFEIKQINKQSKV